MTGIFHESLLLLDTFQQGLDTHPSQINTGNQGNPPKADHNHGNQLLMLTASLLQLTDASHDHSILDIWIFIIRVNIKEISPVAFCLAKAIANHNFLNLIQIGLVKVQGIKVQKAIALAGGNIFIIIIQKQGESIRTEIWRRQIVRLRLFVWIAIWFFTAFRTFSVDLIARIRLLTCRPIGQICYRTRIITQVFKIFINRRIKAGAHNLNNNQGHG